MRLFGYAHSEKGLATASPQSLAVRFASILMVVVLAASLVPMQAKAVPLGDIQYDRSDSLKPGQTLYLDNRQFYIDNKEYEFITKGWFVEGDSGVIEVHEEPAENCYTVQAKNVGTATMVEFALGRGGSVRLYIVHTITVSPYEITLAPNSGSATYDGTEKSVSGFETLEFQIDSKTFTVSGVEASAKGVDAGEYPVAVTGDAVIIADGKEVPSSWCELSYEDAKLAIGKRPVKLSSASDAREYNGDPLTNHEVAVGGDGWAPGEGATYTFTGSQTIVGSSDNSFEYALNEGTKEANYDIETELGTLAVSDRSAPFEITLIPNSGSATYDGAEKSVSGFETLEFQVEGNAFTVSGVEASAKGVDAGEYPVAVTGSPVVTDADGNDVTAQFKVSIADAKLVIVKNESEAPSNTTNGTPSANPASTSTNPASTFAKTGDNAAPSAMGICGVAVVAAAVALVARRKRTITK